MSDQYAKFTYDYAKLKPMGFTFQRLFASNYMQWEKDGFRVWKKGNDVTSDDFDMVSMIKFIRSNPKVRKLDKVATFYYERDAETGIPTYLSQSEENRKKWRKFFYEEWEDLPEGSRYWMDSMCVKLDKIDFIKDWLEKGWIELAEY